MDSISGTFFINLEHRKDRLSHIEKELQKLPLKNVQRLDAIQHERGFMGCTMSHIACLEKAIENGYDTVFICEDDLCFENHKQLEKSVKTFFESGEDWDVFIICGNVWHSSGNGKIGAVKTAYCLTTTGYIVRKPYYNILLNNFKAGLGGLSRRPNKRCYRIDMFWRSLQRKDLWFHVFPSNAYQLESYSDIEKKNVDYKASFLKLGQP